MDRSMDRSRSAAPQSSATKDETRQRQLAHLKVLSRLLGHEMHAQTGPRIALSRDEVAEIRTCLDLFIEEAMEQRSDLGVNLTSVESQPVQLRVN